jgi:hypothetical protein
MKQLKLNFRAKADRDAGFRAGFKDRPLKTSASADYKVGYANGQRRRNCDLK